MGKNGKRSVDIGNDKKTYFWNVVTLDGVKASEPEGGHLRVVQTSSTTRSDVIFSPF